MSPRTFVILPVGPSCVGSMPDSTARGLGPPGLEFVLGALTQINENRTAFYIRTASVSNEAALIERIAVQETAIEERSIRFACHSPRIRRCAARHLAPGGARG